jgi:hypothetical protein
METNKSFIFEYLFVFLKYIIFFPHLIVERLYHFITPSQNVNINKKLSNRRVHVLFTLFVFVCA